MTTKQADITKENTNTIQPFISIVFHQYGNDIVAGIQTIYTDFKQLSLEEFTRKYDHEERDLMNKLADIFEEG